MSRENVEVLRRIVEATNSKDWHAVLADLDPEVEIDDVDIRAAGDDQVIALFTMVVKGRGSGIELRRADALVASLRGGKATKLGYYNDQAQALEAVGLSE